MTGSKNGAGGAFNHIPCLCSLCLLPSPILINHPMRSKRRVIPQRLTLVVRTSLLHACLMSMIDRILPLALNNIVLVNNTQKKEFGSIVYPLGSVGLGGCVFVCLLEVVVVRLRFWKGGCGKRKGIRRYCYFILG